MAESSGTSTRYIPKYIPSYIPNQITNVTGFCLELSANNKPVKLAQHVPSALRCAICKHICKKLLRLQDDDDKCCEHRYCNKCVEELKKVKSGFDDEPYIKCKFCDLRCQVGKEEWIQADDKEVSAIRIFCQKRPKGCPETTTIGSLLEHLKTDCDYVTGKSLSRAASLLSLINPAKTPQAPGPEDISLASINQKLDTLTLELQQAAGPEDISLASINQKLDTLTLKLQQAPGPEDISLAIKDLSIKISIIKISLNQKLDTLTQEFRDFRLDFLSRAPHI